MYKKEVIIIESSKVQPFLTYDEQIKKLQKDGLTIPDEDYAISVLKNISYYSLICGYKDIFKDNSTNKYREEATFEDIISLYQFDESLRNIVFKYILRIERKLRSCYSYAFCGVFKESQSNYLNVNNYNYTQFQDKINGLIIYLKDAIQTDKDYIKHHKTRHNNVPLWVLVNTLTFGNISVAYECSQTSIMSKIAQEFTNIYPNQLVSILKFLTKFRNVCAHNERLYSHKTNDAIVNLPIHKRFNNPQIGKNDLFAVCICLKYLLENDTFLKFITEVNESIDVYLNGMNKDIKNDILTKMGFQNDNLNELTKPT